MLGFSHSTLVRHSPRWVGIATTFRGFLLWPGAILHAFIAVALLTQLLATKPWWIAGSLREGASVRGLSVSEA